MADINKLVMLGRLDRTVTIGGVNFKIVTPTFKYASGDTLPHPIDILSDNIVSIDDEDYSTPESKDKLKEKLGVMQGAIVAKLLENATELVQKQLTAIDEITTKKE